jgi:adenosine deaminase
MARENIIYSEVQLAPGYHSIYTAPWYSAEMYEQNLFPPMTLDQVAEAVLAGFDQGMKETGVVVNTNFCIPRESLDVWGPDSVENYLNLCFRFQTDGVVAMGLACDEYKYSPDPYIEYFRRLKGSRIRGNPHGGEMGPDQQRLQNIMTCFFGLGAHGITHALPIHQNKFLMYMASKTNVRIERTPLSPVPGCSLADGHLDVLLKYKVPVVITSDDPVLMQASLTDNWVAVLNYHQFGEEQFWQMTANAVNTAFYRDQAQKTLVQDMFVKQGLSPSLLK